MNSEQYSRRACLRIHGIPLPKKAESATDCMSKVKEVFKEIEVTVPDEAIDRAHRIGAKVKDDNTGEVRQAMIVKFLRWKHRTAVYKGRKKSKDKKILLDLTAKRAKLLKFAMEKTESDDHIDFVFADINCRVGLKTMDGEFKFFRNEIELKAILDDMT